MIPSSVRTAIFSPPCPPQDCFVITCGRCCHHFFDETVKIPCKYYDKEFTPIETNISAAATMIAIQRFMVILNSSFFSIQYAIRFNTPKCFTTNTIVSILGSESFSHAVRRTRLFKCFVGRMAEVVL